MSGLIYLDKTTDDFLTILWSDSVPVLEVQAIQASYVLL